MKLLTAAEERTLIGLAQAGDAAARDRVLAANQGLVWQIARRYASLAVCADDLAQAGNIGLMRAGEKFDVSRGRFTTYAYHWVHMMVRRCLRRYTNIVALPESMTGTLRSLNRKVLNGDPVVIPTRHMHAIRALAAARVPHCSLDAARHRTVTPDPTLNLRSEEALNALDRLPKRSRNMLLLRFGLLGGECWNLPQIAKSFNLSKERVRQIEAESLEKMRAWLEGVE